MRLNDWDLFIRPGNDRSHGLGWYGSGKPFALTQPDGPVVYGWNGGALGSKSGGEKIALLWNSSQDVGIGTTAPAARLHVAYNAQNVGLFSSTEPSGSWLHLENTATGGGRWSFISTGPNNGEGAGQLLSYRNGARVIFRDNGSVGIGTITPGDKVEIIRGYPATCESPPNGSQLPASERPCVDACARLSN
jgi:hypothetical protein